MALPEAVGILSGLSALFSVCCVIFHAVGFGTRNWIEGDGVSPFVNMGFHEACFDNCYEPWCPGGDESVIFNGCWWVHNYHFQSIWWWLIPDWLMALRDMAIGMIPLTVMCLVFSCIGASIALAGRYTTDSNRGRDIALVVILFVSAILFLITACMGMTILMRFSMNSIRKDWLPMPERNHYGYSWWLEVVTVILLSISALFSLIAGLLKILDMGDEKDTAYAEDMMAGHR